MLNVTNPYSKPSQVTDVRTRAEIKLDSPGVPPNSCPYVDLVMRCVQDIAEAYDNLDQKGVRTPMVNSTEQLASDLLEHLRAMNECLRDNSHYWYDQYKEQLNS